MRGFAYFVVWLAIVIWGPSLFNWALAHGFPISLAVFVCGVALGAAAWHVAAWLVRDKNW